MEPTASGLIQCSHSILVCGMHITVHRTLLSSLQSAVVDSLVEFDNLEQCRRQFRVRGLEDQVNSAPDAKSTKPNLRLHANFFLPPLPPRPLFPDSLLLPL